MLSGITGSRYGYILLCHNRLYDTDRLAVGVKTPRHWNDCCEWFPKIA